MTNKICLYYSKVNIKNMVQKLRQNIRSNQTIANMVYHWMSETIFSWKPFFQYLFCNLNVIDSFEYYLLTHPWANLFKLLSPTH